MSGSRPRLVQDAAGATWQAWYQGKSSPNFDTVRFYGPHRALRFGGIPAGTWAQLPEGGLELALAESWARPTPTSLFPTPQPTP